MPGLADLFRNPRRLRQFAETPGQYPAALDYARQGQPQSRLARRPASRASSAKKEPGTLETGEVIEQVALPDGSLVRPATESGKLVKVPGKSNLFVDPANGEPFQADPSKPTGLRSAYETARQVKRDGKVYASISGIGERELGPDPKVAENAAKAEAKRAAENRRLAFAREKRPYNIDRVTGEPVPLQSDEAWAAAKQAKAAKLDEAARVKRLKDQADLLELDAEDIRETAPKPAKEDEEAFTAAEAALSPFAAGQNMDEVAAKYAEAPATDEASQQAKAAAENYLTYKDKVKPAKEAEAKALELKRRARDIQRQILDPKGWKEGKAIEITSLPDDDLVAEVKAQADIINEQEKKAVGTLDFITKGRNEIVKELNDFTAARQRQAAAGMTANEIQAADDTQAQMEQALADYDDWNSEAKGESEAALKAAADRRDVLKVAGTEIERRHNTWARPLEGKWGEQQKNIVANAEAAGLPKPSSKNGESPSRALLAEAFGRLDAQGIQQPRFIGSKNEPEGDRAAGKDIESLLAGLTIAEQKATDPKVKTSLAKEKAYWEEEAKNSMTAEEWQSQTGEPDLKYPQEKAAVLAKAKPLYENWAKGLYSEDWRAEEDTPRLSQEAAKAGLSVPEAKEALQTYRQLDWSNQRRDPQTGRPITEAARLLPSGEVTVNPSNLLDPEAYDAAVDAMDTTPEAKARAKAMRADLAAPVAEEAYNNLRKNSDFAEWLDANTTGTPLERMEKFNAEMKAGGALNASLMKFLGSAASLPSGWLGTVAGLTGSDKALEYANYWQDRAQAYGTAAGEAGKGTNMAGRFMASVAGGLPSVMESMAAGGVAGRVLGSGMAALGVAAVDAAAQSGGGAFVDAVNAYVQQGMTPEEAKAKAAAPAIASGLVTGVLTAIGGGGVESLLRVEGRELAKSAIKRGLKAIVAREVVEGVSEEGLEEYSDQLLQGVIAQATYAPNKPVEQILSEAIEAGLVGGVLGGGASGIRAYGEANQAPDQATPTDAGGPAPMPVQPRPAGPAPTPAPETAQDVTEQIAKFNPTGATPLPQSVAATAKRTGRPPAAVAKQAAAGVVKIAQGQSLESLDIEEQEALGFVNKGGKITPDTKVTPLVYLYKDKPVLRNAAAEWLTDEAQEGLAGLVNLTEAERKAQIDAEEAAAKAKPAKKKAGQAPAAKAESTPQDSEVVITEGSLPSNAGASPAPATISAETEPPKPSQTITGSNAEMAAEMPVPDVAPATTGEASMEQPPAPPQEAPAKPAPAASQPEPTILSPAQAARATPEQKARAAKKAAKVKPPVEAAAVDQAAGQAATSPTNTLLEPSEAQKEAGNYQKGHTTIAGLNISIENAAGSKRRPKWGKLADHYGYIKGSIDNTGEHADVFIKPGTPEDYAGPVHVVTQIDPKTGKFDEFKTIIGYPAAAEAEQAYRANYTPDWQGFGGIQEMSLDEFKAGLADMTAREKAARQTAPPARPATPEGRAEAALAEYVAGITAGLKDPATKAITQRKLDLAKRLSARLKAMTGVVDYDVLKPELREHKGELEVHPSGILFINPAKLIDRLAKDFPNMEKARGEMDAWMLHEFIHMGALSKMSASKITGLYQALTPEAKEASRKLYFGGKDTQFADDFQAAHEWFAQQVEAILRGEIANSGDIKGLTDPTLRESMIALLRDFVAQLRDIAATLQGKNAKLAAEIRAQAEAVGKIASDMAAKAGLELGRAETASPAGPEVARQADSPAGAEAKKGPPSLGDTGKAIWQGWKNMVGINVMPGESIVGVDVHNGGEYFWSGDELMRSTTNAKQGYALSRPATKAEIEGLHDSIDRGGLQIESRINTGATGMFPKVEGGKTTRVFHQATGKPLAEFLETPAGKKWKERDAETQAIIAKLNASQPEAPRPARPVTAEPSPAPAKPRPMNMAGQVRPSRTLPKFTLPPQEPFKPSAERFAQFYRDYGIPEEIAMKNGANLMDAIETGEWTNLLHPDNKRSRAIWEVWARQKLPAGVKASEEAFAKFITNYHATTSPVTDLTDEELGRELTRLEPLTRKPNASEATKARALAVAKEIAARQPSPAAQAPAEAQPAGLGLPPDNKLGEVSEFYDLETKQTIQSGKPVTFNYARNNTPAFRAGATFQQDIEPAGRYLSPVSASATNAIPSLEYGEITLNSPLVLEWRGYGEDGWKKRLSERFGGKKGKALSKAIAAAGYDGVITVSPTRGGQYATETVDLRMFKPAALALPPGQPAVTAGQDAEYLAAVEAGDMAKAQSMVDEAADSMPFTVKPPRHLYRGETDGQGQGTYALGKGRYSTPDKKTASGYGAVKEVDITDYWPRKPLVLPGVGPATGLFNLYLRRNTEFKSLREFNEKYSDVALFLQEKGFDGLVSSDEVVRYTYDPVTRDESGQVIPLSQRFNPASPSILRSPPAPEGGPAASVPTQITRDMRQQLYDRGYTKEQVNKMKPAEAHAILNPPAARQPEAEAEDAAEPGQTDADMEAFITEQQAIAEEEAAAREALRNDPDAIDAVQASGKMSGRNLSKQFEYPEARAVYQALTAARDQLGGPETVQLDKLREWAKETFESDPEKYVQWAADMAEDNKLLDVDEQAVLGQAFQFLTREARLTGDKNIRAILNKVGNYYLDTGTRLAQAMSARRDPLETPQERWTKALDIVFGPSEAVRRKLRILPTEAGKARRIASLEAELAEARGSRRADVETALKTARAQETKEELLKKDDAESQKIKERVLKNIGVTEDDLMLSGTDRVALQSAILDLPAVKAGLEAYKGKDNDGYNIMRLAFRGFSDEHIANALNLNQDDVGQFIHDATNAIIRPAVAEHVKAGTGFGGLIKAGFARLKKAVGLGLPPKAIEDQPSLTKGTRQTVDDVTAEVNRVMKYALQSAKARNSGKLMSKVVMTPGGQRVRVFVPFDPDDMANYYAFAREFTAAKASAFDKVYEYWINWPLLSGPQTQIANITGNAAQVAWHYTGQRFAEATLNLAYQDPNSAQFREFKHVLKGFWQGIGPAFDMARQTFLTEGDTIRHKYLGQPLEIDVVDGDLDKVGNIRASLGGTAGRINRLPGRVLRFTDAFFKTAIMYAEASAVAYRRAHVAAKAQGLKGKARADFIDTEIANTLNDTSSAVWADVMKTAEELLFQGDNAATEFVDTVLGGYKGIKDLEKLLAEAEAKGDPDTVAELKKRIRARKFIGSLMRWIFPFQRTPTNIIRTGIKKAGGSAISLLYGLTRAGWLAMGKDGVPVIKSYSKAAQIKDASETLLAGLGWLALASMLEGDDNDDEKPVLLVGTRSHSLKERAATDQFLRKYGGENSIVWQDGKGKVLGSLPFGRYEPAATLLTTWIDAYRNYQEVKRLKSQGENASYSTYMLSSLVSSMEDKSFLQGFANAMQFIRDVEEKRENPDESAGLKMMMNNIIPNLIKQPLRNIDDVLRERTTAGVGYAALPNPEIAPKLPVFAAQPKISTTGERLPKAFTPPVRLLFQANTKVTPQPDALLYRANRLHPTKRWSPQPLNRDDYTANPPGKAKPVPITDPAKRRQFAELAGRLYATKAAQVTAKAMPSEKAQPGEGLIKAFKKAREDAMAAARAQAHAMGLHKTTTTP